MAHFDMVEAEIDGRAFEIRILPAKVARKALVRLTKRVAPVVGALVGNSGDTPSENLLDAELDLRGALERIGAELTEDDVDYFCDLFAKYTACEMEAGSGQLVPLDKAGMFDLAFSGRMPTMMRWLWRCFEANFANFFADGGPLSAFTGQVQAMTKR